MRQYSMSHITTRQSDQIIWPVPELTSVQTVHPLTAFQGPVTVSIKISVIIAFEVLKGWRAMIATLGTAVCLTHTCIERFDECLARKLNGMVEAADVVSFIKGVLQFIERSYLDVV
jgi:hypothetical protein